MNTIDNSLHAEIILLATKALDLLNKALDLLSADVVGRSALPLGSSKNASERYSVVGNASERYSTCTDQSTDCHARRRDPLHDSYRADSPPPSQRGGWGGATQGWAFSGRDGGLRP